MPQPCKDRARQRAARGFFSLFVFLHVLVIPVSQPEGSGPSEAQEEGRAWLCHRTSGTICRNSPLPFPNLVKEQGPLSELGPFVPVPREETTSRREGRRDTRSVSQSRPGGDAVPSPRRSGPPGLLLAPPSTGRCGSGGFQTTEPAASLPSDRLVTTTRAASLEN